MSTVPGSLSPIIELEARQDEALALLAELERRTEMALADAQAAVVGLPVGPLGATLPMQAH
jgi:hypothetical protein